MTPPEQNNDAWKYGTVAVTTDHGNAFSIRPMTKDERIAIEFEKEVPEKIQ